MNDKAGAHGMKTAPGPCLEKYHSLAGTLIGTAVGDWSKLLRTIAERLRLQKEKSSSSGAVSYCWPAVPFRNVLFLGIVLAHGFRRLLPPY